MMTMRHCQLLQLQRQRRAAAAAVCGGSGSSTTRHAVAVVVVVASASSSSPQQHHHHPQQQSAATAHPQQTPQHKKQVMRICTNKVCRKQGSEGVLRFARDLGLDDVLDVDGCGCLGNCGSGPNLVLLPQETYMRHVATPTDLAQVLQWLGLDVDQAMLRATELRLAGNALAGGGDFAGAVSKYEEALALDVPRGRHLLYSNLSAAQLQRGDKPAALEAAKQAVATAPRGFHTAAVRLIDALYALGQYDDARNAAQEAAARDAAFKKTPEWRQIEAALSKAGAQATQRRR